MEPAIPSELIEMLEMIKLQNQKLFDMQESQLQWNRQHSNNLKMILNYLENMYTTIKELKSKGDNKKNVFNNSIQGIPTVNVNSIEKKEKTSMPFEQQLQISIPKIQQRNTETPTNPFGQPQKRLKTNDRDMGKLEDILMQIGSEEIFDGILQQNIGRMIPCLVNILLSSGDKQKLYLSLQFTWEVARKHENLFRSTYGMTYATQLYHALEFFSKKDVAKSEESPLNEKELQWLLDFVQQYCP
ncbi:Uncharacterized protein QTN25_001021 [Entamoeba marina]